MLALSSCWLLLILFFCYHRVPSRFDYGLSVLVLSSSGSSFFAYYDCIPNILLFSAFFLHKLNSTYTGLSFITWLGYGPQSYHIPGFCRWKHTGQHTRRTCHVLAVMGKQYILSSSTSPSSSIGHIQTAFRIFLEFSANWILQGLVALRGVLNLALPSFLLFLWSSGSTSAQVRRSILLSRWCLIN